LPIKIFILYLLKQKAMKDILKKIPTIVYILAWFAFIITIAILVS